MSKAGLTPSKTTKQSLVVDGGEQADVTLRTRQSMRGRPRHARRVQARQRGCFEEGRGQEPGPEALAMRVYSRQHQARVRKCCLSAES
ncbi:hypothetical protein L209DRAFT_459514 [Thermothelomyces heterothallicus CBS 203.75]